MPRARLQRACLLLFSALGPALATLAAGSLAGCGDDPGLGTCGGSKQPCCGDTCNVGLLCQDGTCRAPDRSPIDLRYRTKIDLLFLVDDSSSMDAMQQELRSRFPQFFAVFS